MKWVSRNGNAICNIPRVGSVGSAYDGSSGTNDVVSLGPPVPVLSLMFSFVIVLAMLVTVAALSKA
jgi:hypothetical protein